MAERRQGSDSEFDYSSNDSSSTSSESSSEEEFSPAHIEPYSFEPRFEVEQLEEEEDEEMRNDDERPRRLNNLDWYDSISPFPKERVHVIFILIVINYFRELFCCLPFLFSGHLWNPWAEAGYYHGTYGGKRAKGAQVADW